MAIEKKQPGVTSGKSATPGKEKPGDAPAAARSKPAFAPEAIRRDAGYRLLSEAIKALTIVNGGAAVAALAFLGQLSQRIPLTSIVIRDAGVVLLVLAVGTISPPVGAVAFAYFSFYPKKWVLWTGRFAILISPVAFCFGLFFGWRMLSPLGFFNVEVQH